MYTSHRLHLIGLSIFLNLLLGVPAIASAQTGAPAATITASPTVIAAGGSATITWSSTGAAECSLVDGSGYLINTGVSQRSGFSGTYAGGSLTTSAANTYSYGCSNSAGITGWKSVSVAVCAQGQTVTNGVCVTPAPVQTQAATATITASPSVIAAGGAATITWSSMNATECSLYDNNGYIINTGNTVKTGVSGTYANGSLTTSAANTYYYGCSNSSSSTGWKSASVTVCAQGQTVTNGACVTPAPVQTTPTATITASPAVVAAGGSATVTWSAVNATECSLYDNNGYVINTGNILRSGVSGTYASGSVTTNGSNSYSYGCSNSSGGTGWKSASVTVCAQGQTVMNGACVTPAPVQTQAATATITASPSVIAAGGTATVTWSSPNATECSLYDNAGYLINTGVVKRSGFSGTYANGSLTTSAANTYSYGCSNSSGSTGWKSASVTVCAQGQTVLDNKCTGSIPTITNTAKPTGTYTQWNFPYGNGIGLDDMAWDVTVNSDPSPQPYFYSTQFRFFNDPNASGGGYFGIQTQGSDPTGKIAIFSLWNTSDSNGPGFSGTFGGEGTGRSVRISYPWIPGRTYHLRVLKGSSDATGQWWEAWIKDSSTQGDSFVGRIKEPATITKLDYSPISWTEYYGPNAVNCSAFNLSDVSFTNMTGNGGKLRVLGHTNSLASTVNCPGSYAVDAQDGTRQQMASTQAPPVYTSPTTNTVPTPTPQATTPSTPAVHPLGLTESQIQSIIGLLQSFGANQDVIDSVFGSLHGIAPKALQQQPVTQPQPVTTTAPVSLGGGTNQTTNLFDVGTGLASDSVTVQSQPIFIYTWNKDLQIGSPYTADVTALQTALTHEGVYSGDITGGFYNQTYWAVQDFQQKYGINVTGYVGPDTRAKLNSLY